MKLKMLKFIGLSILLVAAMVASAQADEAARAVFVSGKVEMAGQSLAVDGIVSEGAELSTGADGYVYLKTVDNGFFILRPNSRARIVSYHVDQKNPLNTRIKFELINGVARSISGDAVKLARQNFRFNTPVAAIGVRGTDFTVHTTQDASRVTVISGGIIVSGFAAGCSPQGIGPCEGGASAELFARQHGQLLQITKGQVKPQLMQSSGVAPDIVAPPRADEPTAKPAAANNAAVPVASAENNLDAQKAAENKLPLVAIVPAVLVPIKEPILAPPVVVPPVVVPPVVTPPVVDPLASQIIWGRWKAIENRDANIDLAQYSAAAKKIAIRDAFVILQRNNTQWQLPTAGSMGFALKDGEAYVNNQATGAISPAQIQNASLNVDFSKLRFTTSFDLLTNNEIFKRQAEGKVYSDGQFTALNFFPSNLSVDGVLASEKGGSAAYLFQTHLADTRFASGILVWGKQ